MNGIIGIVAEYNPFHNGHFYHIQRSRSMLGGESTVVAVMTGDFVQRGECALYQKFTRAEAAAAAGADLVVELPLPWCLSSAEGFARGAVGLLGALGATHLSFGSEAGETDSLRELAELLRREEFQAAVAQRMKEEASLSYAAARELTAEKILGEKAKLLEGPNNILGIEYMKAAAELALPMELLTVARSGSGHDSFGGSGFKSASELRRCIREGESPRGELPAAALSIYRAEEENGRQPMEMAHIEQALLARLRMLSLEECMSLPDAADGLGRRLYEAIARQPSFDLVCAEAKTKRYALARIRRMLLCGALGVKAGDADSVPPYARVLAANERGCRVLGRVNRETPGFVLTKPADVREMSAECQRLFALGARAHDLYALGYRAVEERRGRADWVTGPSIV